MTIHAHRLFHHTGLRRSLVFLRLPLFIALVLAVAPFARAEWLLPGFLVSMAGELLQLWCFASLDKNATLTMRGPYALVRNPMYLGRFLIPLGFLMLLGRWWLLPPYALLYWWYMSARVEREEAHLRPVFGQPYADYSARVSRFVPRLPASWRTVGYWNWALFRRNHAGLNLLGTLIAWALLSAWLHWSGLPRY